MGAAVNIIITGGPAGRTGFTVSAVCNVTDTPLVLLVCLNRGAPTQPVLNGNRTLCVNTLSAGQEPSSNLLGGKTSMEHRFVTARWQAGATRCPQLGEVPVLFDYRTSQVMSIGTHDILSCTIETIHRYITSYGLVWFDRSYHALMHPAC